MLYVAGEDYPVSGERGREIENLGREGAILRYNYPWSEDQHRSREGPDPNSRRN